MFPDRLLKYFGCIGLILLISFVPAGAQDLNALWQKGNELYARQQYDSALSCFQQIEQQGGSTADLYFNIGNAYYRLGQTAPSVLYYEKALFKNPLNKKIKENLALAQSRVALPVAPSSPVFFIAWWNQFKLFIAPQVWAWLMLGCFAAFLWLIYNRFSGKEKLNYTGRWTALAVSGILLFGLFFYAGYQARTYTNKAVVMKNDTPFYANLGEEQSAGQLPDGAVVRIQDEQEGWYSVILPNGSIVWVASESIIKVQN